MAIQATFLGNGATTGVLNIVGTELVGGKAPVKFFLLQDTDSDDAGIVEEDWYGRLNLPCFCSCTDWPSKVDQVRSERRFRNAIDCHPKEDGQIAKFIEENRAQFGTLREWEQSVLGKYHARERRYAADQVVGKLQQKLRNLEAEVTKLRQEIASAEALRTENEQLLASEIPPMPILPAVARLAEIASPSRDG